MKPFSLLSVLCITFISFSCNKAVDVMSEEESVNSITFTLSEFISDGTEPTTKTSLGPNDLIYWAEKDTVGIYPDTGSQVYFVITGGTNTTSASFNGGGWGLKTSTTYYSYYPFVGDIYLNRNHVPVSFVGQKQIGTTATDHIGPFDFMYTRGSSASSGSVNFDYYHLCSLIKIRLRLPVGTYSNLTLTAPSAVLVTEGYYDLLSASPEIVATKTSKQLSIELEDFSVTDQNTDYYVYLMCAPVDLRGGLTVSVLNGQKTELQCSKTPSLEYTAGGSYGLGCTTWTEVPQSVSMSIQQWDDGESIGGNV